MEKMINFFRNLNFFRNRCVSITKLIWEWKKYGGHGISSDLRLIEDICKVLHMEGGKTDVD